MNLFDIYNDLKQEITTEYWVFFYSQAIYFLALGDVQVDRHIDSIIYLVLLLVHRL